VKGASCLLVDLGHVSGSGRPGIGECDLRVSTSVIPAGYRDKESMGEGWGHVPRQTEVWWVVRQGSGAEGKEEEGCRCTAATRAGTFSG
jgi:hypothetical protein